MSNPGANGLPKLVWVLFATIGIILIAFVVESSLTSKIPTTSVGRSTPRTADDTPTRPIRRPIPEIEPDYPAGEIRLKAEGRLDLKLQGPGSWTKWIVVPAGSRFSTKDIPAQDLIFRPRGERPIPVKARTHRNIYRDFEEEFFFRVLPTKPGTLVLETYLSE